MKEVASSREAGGGSVHRGDRSATVVQIGIPVMGHLGLTPQAINKFGTYEVRATEKEEADQAFCATRRCWPTPACSRSCSRRSPRAWRTA